MKMSRFFSILAIFTVVIFNVSAQQVADIDIQTDLPRLTTAADLFNSTDRPIEKWSGFDPARYKDMSFYKNDGITHLRGRIIDYTPDSDVKTVSIHTIDDISGIRKNEVGEINPDGTFAIDIPLTYPQFDFFKLGNIYKNLFLIPGDTLSVITTMNSLKKGSYSKSFYFGFEGDMDDAVAVNLLADSISDHFDVRGLYNKMRIKRDDSMNVCTYEASEKLAPILDTVVAELPALLGDLPVSGFAKDILSISAIGDVAETIEDLIMDFRLANSDKTIPDSLAPGGVRIIRAEKLDATKFLAPLKEYFSVLYDNPLLICKGRILPNRWKFNGLFRSEYVLKDMEIISLNTRNLDEIGVGNCFAAQFSRPAMTMSGLKDPTRHISTTLDIHAARVTALLKSCDYPIINKALMSSYTRYVKQLALIENQLESNETIGIDPSAHGGVLDRIIAPYRGNVLFLDFWNMGCAPCRAGMIRQKPMLEEYVGKPFKALYISPLGEQAKAEEWMRKEEIKGEHVFVSSDDWNRLQALFNFSAIPFGTIIDKNGNVTRVSCRMPEQKDLLDKMLK